ncbi:MAG: sigma-54 dependent transcriptional regulator [Nitrospiraceae bacterium]
MQATIFVTDDELAIRSAIVKRLSRKQHRVTGYDSGEALLDALAHDTPDVVFLDLKMPGMGGLEALKRVRAQAPQVLVVMLTAYGTVQDAVEAMRAGAYDFLIKSVDLEGVDPVVERAVGYVALRRRMEFESAHHESRYALDHVVAHSGAMKHLLGQVRDVVANPKSTVLLQGETGTGKEFLARVIHHNGSRAKGPFVGVNCTAIPRELFESELFGYERGAFTGANQRKLGLLEKAEGGTLFLDEIGDLDLPMQAKLLRVLQERTFRRVGGTEDQAVEFRLITATNRDLKTAVAKGTFREDLYFRLNVVAFELPPLRTRVEDIVPLCRRAVLRYAQECGKDVQDLEPDVAAMLERYAFPGNIRELENIIERAMIFCQGKTLSVENFPSDLRQAAKPTVVTVKTGAEPVLRLEVTLGQQSLVDIEQAIVDEVVRLSDFNKTLAAKHLGLTRFALDRRLRKAQDHES